MTLQCEDARNAILKALAGDLGHSEREQLAAHLLDCPACSRENEISVDALQQLKSISDVPVPRHFFVYAEKDRSWMTRFFQLPSPTRAVAGLATLAFVVFLGLVWFQVHFSVKNGVYAFSFGRLAGVEEGPRLSAVDLAALKAEWVRVLDARSERERSEWMDRVRQELREANVKLNRQQQRQWKEVLTSLEVRLSDRMEEQSLALRTNVDRSMGSLYQTLQLQRRQDLAMTRNVLDRMSTQGELKDKETREILSTLLQVAEFRVK